MVTAQQLLFNLRRLKKFDLSPKTLTFIDAQARFLSGCITIWYSNCSAHNRKALQSGNAVCTTYHRGQTTCTPGHLQHPMSQEGQKDHQGQQPPEPLPVHPAIIQKARCIKAGTERLKNSFYRKAIRLKNSHH
jgi:hypothetical protein